MGSSNRVKNPEDPDFGPPTDLMWEFGEAIKPCQLHSLYQHDEDKIPILCQPH